ncbi:MAG: RNHCP domain-containing protein, partial [Christensenellaceae bacterium]
GEWAILHRCRACGHISSNRVAADDNPVKLMSIAVRPLANPPFPIERLEDEVNAFRKKNGEIGEDVE